MVVSFWAEHLVRLLLTGGVLVGVKPFMDTLAHGAWGITTDGIFIGVAFVGYVGCLTVKICIKRRRLDRETTRSSHSPGSLKRRQRQHGFGESL
ncbi:MAG: hypothetical protein M1832_006385 [Thelocarpon impressellum]|nr:MAG: hypothetical protein M1832_006385 [Thelocarpon impressellum]